MSAPAATTGVFYYVYPDGTDKSGTDEERTRLFNNAAIEPILLRWRDKVTDGLIDEGGKIKNVFTRAERGVEDNVSRVIHELNAIPDAVAELEVALEAQEESLRLHRHLVEMPVHDARQLTEASLHDNGFLLLPHTSAVTDWDDHGELATTYAQETANLVKEMTGARRTFASDYLVRQSEPEEGGNGPLAKLMTGSRGPARAVHNDFTEAYGPGIINTIAAGGVPHTQTFGLTQAMLDGGVTQDEVRSSRILVINTWRSVVDTPLERMPLALIDRRTIPKTSLSTSLIGKIPSGQRRGGIEIFNAAHHDDHRWYYYPNMTRDELLIWKGYDSTEVPARPPMHSAFDDPRTPENAAERKSVEVRVLCLLDP